MSRIAMRAERQVEKILYKEASKLKLRSVKLADCEIGERNGVGHLISTSLLGGRTTVDRLRTYRFHMGDRPVIYICPFAGALFHPPEIHAVVEGTPSRTTVFDGKGWHGDDSLQHNAEVRLALKGFRWTLRSQALFNLKWGLQICPLDNNRSHLVMQAGTYGFWTPSFGLSKFVQVAKAVEGALSPGASERAPFRYPCFSDHALSLLQ
ncbi:MAG: hypothetical protein KC561_04965 [Myxococcales bacterium]|nr:hypothetical protein [Myxococcales bacterium]